MSGFATVGNEQAKAIAAGLYEDAVHALEAMQGEVAEVDPVVLSQDEEKIAEVATARDRAYFLARRCLAVATLANDVLTVAQRLQQLVCTVYFSPNGARNDRLKLFTVSRGAYGVTTFGVVRRATDMVAPGVEALAVASVDDEGRLPRLTTSTTSSASRR